MITRNLLCFSFNSIYAFIFVALAFVAVLVALFNRSSSQKTTKDKYEHDSSLLFTLYADNVEVIDGENSNRFKIIMNSEQDNTHSRAFTDIPKHISREVGTVHPLYVMFNLSKNNLLENFMSSSEALAIRQDHGLAESLETLSRSFVEENPNCAIYFVKSHDSSSVTNFTNDKTNYFPSTIAKLITFEKNNNDYTLEYEILNGESKIPLGSYEHVSITIDNFWDDAANFFTETIPSAALATTQFISENQEIISSAGAVAGAAVGCAALESVTFGVATAGCALTMIGASASLGNAIDKANN